MVDHAQAACDSMHDSGVARRVVHLHQHLERQKHRPDIECGLLGLVDEGLARAQPPVFVLMRQDVVAMARDLCDQRIILQQVGQGDHAVQPIGRALPALLIAAEPAALADIGPELVQMAAQAAGL